MKLFQLFESRELSSEFLWFQKYITGHDLETQMEIKNDKIVFRAGKQLVKQDAVEARRIRTEVMPDSEQSFRYARNVIKGRFELGEKAIAKSASSSYFYAREIIKGRFELGEPAISKDIRYFHLYTNDVIKGPFELGEFEWKS